MNTRLQAFRPLALAGALLLCCLGTAVAAGEIDRGFGADGVATVPAPEGGVVWDLAAAPGGGMAAAVGNFTKEGSLFAVARLRADGSPDPGFGEGGIASFEVGAQGEARGVAVQADGRLLVAGSRYVEGIASPVLARLRRGGALDPSFGDGGLVRPRSALARRDVLYDVAVQPGGRIVAAGARNEDKLGRSAAILVAYRPDGRVDRGFGSGGRVVLWGARRGLAYTAFRDVVALPGGRLLAAGFRRGNLLLARLDRDGSLDRGFGGGDGIATASIDGTGYCRASCVIGSGLAVGRDGRIVVLGGTRGGRPGLGLARFTPRGRLDRSFAGDGVFFGPTPLYEAFDLALQPGGRVVVVGIAGRQSEQPRSEYSFGAVRFGPGGRLDRGFGNGVVTLPRGLNSVGFAALARPGGRVVAGGGVQARNPKAGYSLLLTRFAP